MPASTPTPDSAQSTLPYATKHTDPPPPDRHDNRIAAYLSFITFILHGWCIFIGLTSRHPAPLWGVEYWSVGGLLFFVVATAFMLIALSSSHQWSYFRLNFLATLMLLYNALCQWFTDPTSDAAIVMLLPLMALPLVRLGYLLIDSVRQSRRAAADRRW